MLSLETAFAASCDWSEGTLRSESRPKEAADLADLLRELGEVRPCFWDQDLPVALKRHVQLRLRDANARAEALELLREHPAITSALPGNLSRPASPLTEPLVGTQRPAKQWYLEHMGVTRAWARASGRGVRVAVIDLGFDLLHPDLAPNVLSHLGRDFANPSDQDDISDGDTSHGTASTSLLAAAADGTGMAGVAYECEVIPYQWRTNVNTDEVPFETAIANAIVHAASLPSLLRPHVILPVIQIYQRGSIEFYPVLRDAVSFAVEQGIHVVLPAGNSAMHLGRERNYDTGSIIVGASTQQDALTDWSNYGERIDVVAPGDQVVAATPGGGHIQNFWGTSAASPLTAGVVALMVERNPNLDPRELRSRLRASARIGVGYPAVDAERAVELANLGRGPDDHMEFLAGATPLVGALEIDGRLERSGDEDVFSFRSPGNETQVFRLTFPSGAIGDVTLDLVGRDGKTVLRPWDRDYATYVRFPFSNPGMYYLRVRGRLTSGHYRITREIRSP